MAASSKPTSIKVALLAWPKMDLTDLAGPIEVLSHARIPALTGSRLFSYVVAAASETTITSQDLAISRHLTLNKLIEDIDSIDTLIVPGGGGIKADAVPQLPGLQSAIAAFASLPPRGHGQRARTIISICTGSFFLAEAGLLKGKTATTHWASLMELEKLCGRHGGATIVRKPFVDAGTDGETGLRVITSGGITNGIQAMLYYTESELGNEVMLNISNIMDWTQRP